MKYQYSKCIRVPGYQKPGDQISFTEKRRENGVQFHVGFFAESKLGIEFYVDSTRCRIWPDQVGEHRGLKGAGGVAVRKRQEHH